MVEKFATTYPVVYNLAVDDSMNIKATRYWVEYRPAGKSVERQPGKIGKAVDPNAGYRIIKCVALLQPTALAKVKGYLLPASAPTYGATYPNVVYQEDGDTAETVLCQFQSFTQNHKTKDRWVCTFTFVERSA